MHSALWQAVASSAEIPADAEKALGKKLTYARQPTARSPMVVVVLDEIDQLMSHNHQVLRKLFEWADAPKSRLVSLFMAVSPAFSARVLACETFSFPFHLSLRVASFLLYQNIYLTSPATAMLDKCAYTDWCVRDLLSKTAASM